MASNKRTIYLGLDYKDFTGGVSEVNRKMGLLDAEFRLAQQQAKNYGNETDALGIKVDYLKQKIALQTQKVEAAKKAYDDAMSSQNASQKTIDALDKKLLQERTTLEKLTGQLNDETQAQDKANKSTETFGDAIRGIASDLGLNVSPAIEKLASNFDGLDKSVGMAIVGISAIVTGFVECSKTVAETADNILTMSSTTGIAADELQKLMYSADLVDVSVDTMSGSMTRMIRNMNSARDGSSEAQEAFQKLGIRITDASGHLRDSNDVFYEAIDRLGRMKNETERDALAMEIFGKSARELNPLIEAGSGRLKELGDEAERLGRVLSDEELQKAGALQDAFDRMSQSTEALKNSLGLALLPILTSLIDAIASIPTETLKTIVIIASVIASIMLIVKAIKSLTETGEAISKFISGFSTGASQLTLKIMGVVAAVIILVVALSVLFGKGDDLNRSFASIGGTVEGLTGTVTKAQTNTYNAGNHASGTANFAGGRTWVGEAGPELLTLPGGTAITPANEVGRTEHNVFNITIDAKNVRDFQRVVELAEGQKMALRRI